MNTADFACHAPDCAPPPAGTGGSLPKGVERTADLDTDVADYGLRFVADAHSNPAVVAGRDFTGWDDLPTTDVRVSDLTATERYVSGRTVDRIVASQALRKGYDPHVVIDKDGVAYIADGNHRAAMFAGMGRETMPAKVLDLRKDTHQALVAACYSKECAPPPIGKGGSSPAEVHDAHEHATKLLSKAQEAEQQVTPAVSAVVKAAGGEMVGLEHRLKTLPSLRRKIHAKATERSQPVPTAADNISDALRYTGVIPTEKYSAAISTAIGALKADGFHVRELDQFWTRGDNYNGVHAILQHPNGAKVELQFHTPESIAAKKETHKLYEIFRDLNTTPQRRLELNTEMVKIADSAPIPAGVGSIGTAKMRA